MWLGGCKPGLDRFVGGYEVEKLTNNRTNNQHGLAVGMHNLRHRFHREVLLLRFNAAN